MEAVMKYFHDSYEELKKVNWPTRNQTINHTLIVLGMCIGFGIFFFVLDTVFRSAIQLAI